VSKVSRRDLLCSFTGGFPIAPDCNAADVMGAPLVFRLSAPVPTKKFVVAGIVALAASSCYGHEPCVAYCYRSSPGSRLCFGREPHYTWRSSLSGTNWGFSKGQSAADSGCRHRTGCSG
jgi:hypothetical protein